MAALVFVTTELAPFTPGGIGRVLHNMLRSVGEEDRARCIVVAVGFAIDDLSFAVTFPAVRLIRADVRDSVLQDHSSRHLPPRWAYSHSDLHWQSAAVMSTLEQLARTTAIEYVEFPDWGGLAFCTLQERRFSGLLADACLAVRLHSTHTQILNAEPYAVTPIDLHIADIERKCLRDCDRIVAQIPSVAEATRRLLDFDIAEWDHRIIVHAPPVLLDYSLPALQSVEAGPLQSLMFTSKMQRLKRADVFVRGVTAFMRRDADFHGRACLSAHRTDGAFCEIVDRLIPDDLKSRFAFTPAMSAREREMAISTATVVVASASESFCLAAYEASLLGARVILNGQNPAFDDT
ncbi:MAG: glycosyltransferase, partial [Janthinobacterium lividum]